MNYHRHKEVFVDFSASVSQTPEILIVIRQEKDSLQTDLCATKMRRTAHGSLLTEYCKKWSVIWVTRTMKHCNKTKWKKKWTFVKNVCNSHKEHFFFFFYIFELFPSACEDRLTTCILHQCHSLMLTALSSLLRWSKMPWYELTAIRNLLNLW